MRLFFFNFSDLGHEYSNQFPILDFFFFVLNNQIPKAFSIGKRVLRIFYFCTTLVVFFLWWWIQLLLLYCTIITDDYHLYWFYFGYLSSFSIIFPFRFRIMCHFICNHSLFGNVVLVCIMVSSFMLAAEDPLNSNSEHNKVSNIFPFTQWAEM